MSSFDSSWSTGPHGPFPFLLLSQTENVSERHYLLAPAGGLGGSAVFQMAGALVQYSTATTTAAAVFRRTLSARIGTRGVAIA